VFKLSNSLSASLYKKTQPILARTLTAAWAVLFVAACSTGQQPTKQVLQDLCVTKDLSNTAQRALLAGGYHAIEKNDLACAERLTIEARKVDPKDAYAALNLGAIYQRTGRLEMARSEYQQAIDLDEKSSKDGGTSESSTIATLDNAKNKTPGDIAKRNLERLRK
jgi:tetratricopeptide (TPR) repeat protein